MNTPRYKFREGGTYTPLKGFFGSLSFQHTPSYNIDLGLYSGASDVQNIFDASIGYTFENGIKVALTGTNIFNNKFRAEINYNTPKDVIETYYEMKSDFDNISLKFSYNIL